MSQLLVRIGTQAQADTDQYGVQNVRLVQEYNCHDLLFLTVKSVTRATFIAGDPVEVVVSGVGLAKQRFVGYVSHTEYEQRFRPENESGRFQTVVCIGASYPMKTEEIRNWGYGSLSAIANYLADKHHFEVLVDDLDSSKIPLVQNQESDWAFLVRVAKLWGRVVSIDQATLVVFHPSRMWNADTSVIPFPMNRIFKIDSVDGADLAENNQRGMRDLVSVRSDLVGRSVVGDVNTSKTNLPFRLRTFTNTGGSTSAASRYVSAMASSFNPTARVTMIASGGLEIMPGSLVSLSEGDYKGMWQVCKVEHLVASTHPDNYMISCQVTMDSNQGTVNGRFSKVAFSRPVNDAVLSNGVWRRGGVVGANIL